MRTTTSSRSRDGRISTHSPRSLAHRSIHSMQSNVRLNHHMRYAVALLLVGLAATTEALIYHVTFTDEQNLFARSDVHFVDLSGLNESGGYANASCMNKTVHPYRMKFFNRSSSVPGQSSFSVSAVITSAKAEGAKPRSLAGHTRGCTLNTIKPIVFCPVIFWSNATKTIASNAPPVVAELVVGPNPPPPDPHCERFQAQQRCDGAPYGQCVWCSSKDRLHSLCFAASNKPASASWTCDGNATHNHPRTVLNRFTNHE
jgi:hypothetical protein